MEQTASTSFIDRRSRLILAGLMLVALGWRAFNAFYGDTFYDGFGFVMIARNLLEGRFATPYISSEILYHHDFLYPFAIAGFGAVLGDLLVAARVVGILAGTLLVLPIYGFTRDVFGARPAVYAAALAVIHPMMTDWSSHAYSEPLYLLFGVTGLWWLWRAGLRSSWRWALGGGVVLGLAALTRFQGITLLATSSVGLVAAAALGGSVRVRRAVLYGCLATVVGAAVVAPLTIHVRKHGPVGSGGKIVQELFKKNSVAQQLNEMTLEEDWLIRERSLAEHGERLAWIDAAMSYGPFWLAASHWKLHLGRVLRDLGILVHATFNRRYMPFLIMLPLLIQIAVDARRREGRRGFYVYVSAVGAGTVLAVALVAVAMDRYLAILAPLFILPAGGGIHNVEQFLQDVLRRDRLPPAVFRSMPYFFLVLAIAGYPSPKIRDYDDPTSEPDYLSRRVAEWASPHLDPSVPETIMATTPAVPAYTGDKFFLLPIATPEVVARYAHAQGADYVLMEEWYLEREDPGTRGLWERGDLSAVGLERLDRRTFRLRENDYRTMVLFRVTGIPDPLQQWSATDPYAEDRPPNVIVVSLDSLRADHVGAYGYPRDTTPGLDRLAARGVRFANVLAQSPDTTGSNMSLLTGTYPARHGAYVLDRLDPPEIHPVDGGSPSIAEAFRDAGYRTSAWTGGRVITSEVGFSRGFEELRENLESINPGALLLVRNWLRSHQPTPCFAFLQTYEVHAPYTPPGAYRAMFGFEPGGRVIGDYDELLALANDQTHRGLSAVFWGTEPGEIPDPERFDANDVDQLVRLYDGGIRKADDVLAQLVEWLEQDELLQHTVLAITAGHGEEFLEHGRLEHRQLYRESLAVPLILVRPGRLPEGHVVATRVEAFDLGPTLLELAGVAVPEGMEASSLVPLLDPDAGRDDRAAYSEIPWARSGQVRSLRDDHWSLIEHADGRLELYDLATDPGEHRDVAGSRPDLVRALKDRMDSLRSTDAPPGGPDRLADAARRP